MQNLETIFWSNNSGIKSLFIIVAHPDDFEIGCLGAVLRMYKSNFRFKIYILVMCTSNKIRKLEQISSIKSLKEIGLDIHVRMLQYVDTTLPENIYKIKNDLRNELKIIEKYSDEVCILTHNSKDRHQDHATIFKSVTQTARSHRIICFDIPKYEVEGFTPSFFVCLKDDIVNEKISHIMRHFHSQIGKKWFNQDVFSSCMMVNGIHANCKYAEAFFIENMVL
jgi:LmbE family N-acetylglucosaminyl deacetylase